MEIGKKSLSIRFTVWLVIMMFSIIGITATMVANGMAFHNWYESYKSREEVYRFIEVFRTTHGRLQLAILYSDRTTFDNVSNQQSLELSQFSDKFSKEEHSDYQAEVIAELKSLHNSYVRYALTGVQDFDKSEILAMNDLKFDKILEKLMDLLRKEDANFFATSGYLIDIATILDDYGNIATVLFLFVLLTMIVGIYRGFLAPFSATIEALQQVAFDDWKESGRRMKELAEKMKPKSIKETQFFLTFIVNFFDKIKETNDKLNEAVILDGKTKLYNYRYFESMLSLEVTRSKRFGHPMGLLMVDVDYFKFYNDSNGHVEGDVVLVAIADIIKKQVRETDVPSRFGGEEFAIILPNTHKQDAMILADRLRTAVEGHEFKYQNKQPNGNLTISIGVASLPEDAANGDLLVRCSDIALYEAKRSGRNKVASYDTSIMKR